MATKEIGKLREVTEVFQGNDETWEEKLQEVTCDVCGQKAIGTIGPFGGVCGQDAKGPWASANFYVRDPNFNVYNSNDDQQTLYWYIAERDDAHACNECAGAGLVNLKERKGLLVIPDEGLNLKPMETYPFKNDPEDMN